MAEPTSFYTGWLLDPGQREALLERFPPRYARAVAHHVTMKFGDRAAVAPGEVAAEIIGQADDGAGVQAMVVRIDGAAERPDGGTFHITWSLGPGRDAKESNDVIATTGWSPIEPPAPLRLLPKPQAAVMPDEC